MTQNSPNKCTKWDLERAGLEEDISGNDCRTPAESKERRPDRKGGWAKNETEERNECVREY